jgi:hypothetical protein
VERYSPAAGSVYLSHVLAGHLNIPADLRSAVFDGAWSPVQVSDPINTVAPFHLQLLQRRLSDLYIDRMSRVGPGVGILVAMPDPIARDR